MPKLEFRPYQQKIFNIIKDEISEKDKENKRASAIVQLATGLGKTIIFSQIPTLLPPDKRALVFAHRDDLIQQAANQLKKWNPGIDLGIEAGASKAGDA